MLLGEVLREQAGDALFEKVEELRLSAIRRREALAEGSIKEAEDLLQLAVLGVNSMPVDQAYQLSRAFGFYFELINLAETNHRKRRRLSLQLTGEYRAQRGSLRGTLRAMRACGIPAEEALDWLRQFSSFPSSPRTPRRLPAASVLIKRRRIGEFLEQLDRIPLPDEQLATLEESSRRDHRAVADR